MRLSGELFGRCGHCHGLAREDCKATGVKCHKCLCVRHFQKFCKTPGAAHKPKVYTVEQ